MKNGQKSGRKTGRKKNPSKSENPTENIQETSTKLTYSEAVAGMDRFDESEKMVNEDESNVTSSTPSMVGSISKRRSVSFAEIATVNGKETRPVNGSKPNSVNGNQQNIRAMVTSRTCKEEMPQRKRSPSGQRVLIVNKVSLPEKIFDANDSNELNMDDQTLQEFSDLMTDVANIQLKEDSEKNKSEDMKPEVKPGNMETVHVSQSNNHSPGFQTQKVFWNTTQQLYHKHQGDLERQKNSYNNTNQFHNTSSRISESSITRFGNKNHYNNYVPKWSPYQRSNGPMSGSSTGNRYPRVPMSPNPYTQVINYTQHWYQLPEIQAMIGRNDFQSNVSNFSTTEFSNNASQTFCCGLYNNPFWPYFVVPATGGQPAMVFVPLTPPTMFCVPIMNTYQAINTCSPRSPSPPEITYAAIVGQGLNRNQQSQRPMQMNTFTSMQSSQQHCMYFNGGYH